MAKITPMEKAVALHLFRKVYTNAQLDWDEDEALGLAPEDRRRAWWSKDAIMRICKLPGSWPKLRKMLEKELGLIMLLYSGPRRDLCFTFPTSDKDRERAVINAFAIQVGLLKWVGNLVQSQLAPVDGKYPLTEANRASLDAALLDRGTKLDKVIKSIAEIKGAMWQDDILSLTAQPAATEGAEL